MRGQMNEQTSRQTHNILMMALPEPIKKCFHKPGIMIKLVS